MWHSLGKVTVAAAGTLAQATANETTPSARYACQTVFFQQIQTNTGKIYICDRQNANRTTLVGVLAVIPIPTIPNQGGASILPYASVTVPSAPAALSANQFWIDVDNSGESCLVSVVRN